MTTIYNCNKNNRKHAIVLRSARKYSSRKKRKLQCFINEAGEYIGHIKLVILLLIPFLMIGSCWLVLFGKNISLNYMIHNLKNEISQNQEELDYLTERSAFITSSQEIEEWARDNDFIKVENISYLNLMNDNLAQRQVFYEKKK
jgi:hypothetical protein